MTGTYSWISFLPSVQLGCRVCLRGCRSNINAVVVEVRNMYYEDQIYRLIKFSDLCGSNGHTTVHVEAMTGDVGGGGVQGQEPDEARNFARLS